MTYSRRGFVAGLLLTPVLVRASSLEYIPRSLVDECRGWWWNPRPMCGQDIGFYYGPKPRGFGWSDLDTGFHTFPHGSVRSINPMTYKDSTP